MDGGEGGRGGRGKGGGGVAYDHNHDAFHTRKLFDEQPLTSFDGTTTTEFWSSFSMNNHYHLFIKLLDEQERLSLDQVF